jgi:phosphoadenosine phosphosulfate reductase
MSELNSWGIDKEIAKSEEIMRQAVERFGPDKIAIGWTGGKDSTVMLWIFKNLAEKDGFRLPKCMFIDDGDVFDEIREFTSRITLAWGLELHEVSNKDVLSKGHTRGDSIMVSSLNEENKSELARINFSDESFPFESESLVGNHLMKTSVMNRFLRDHNVTALTTAIRWDEQPARMHESAFSRRDAGGPDHWRIHPLLHFTERDIWNTIFAYDIPYCRLYEEGYRSLGSHSGTTKVSDVPAWQQDLENTGERDGRGQEKEMLMDRLRSLGYM